MHKAALIAVASLVAVLVCAVGVVVYLRHQVATSTAITTPEGIDESYYVKVGGIPQFIRIRGQDKGNPAILFLHGGPGGATLSASNQPFAPWERFFTVVHWDQRGSGLTYARNGYDASSTTIDRLVLDGLGVAEHVRNRLGKQRLILLGHSWGSHLGFTMANRRPDLFSAYVATGLWVNFAKSQAKLYDVALANARKAEDAEAVRQLESASSLAYDNLDRWKLVLRWSAKPGDPTFPNNLSLILGSLLSPEYSPSQVFSYVDGFEASSKLLGREAMRHNLELGAKFEIPVFLFQGAQDGHVDVDLAVAYVRSISAPLQQTIMFHDGGHNVHVTHPQRFLEELLHRVAPLEG